MSSKKKKPLFIKEIIDKDDYESGEPEKVYHAPGACPRIGN